MPVTEGEAPGDAWDQGGRGKVSAAPSGSRGSRRPWRQGESPGPIGGRTRGRRGPGVRPGAAEIRRRFSLESFRKQEGSRRTSPSTATGFLGELRPTLALAGPVILAELGWMAMGVVDTIIVGRLGPEAIGAVSVGGVFFFTVAVFGMGMLLGLDTLISQAFGAGRIDDCRGALGQGIYLGLALTAPLMAVVFAGAPVLGLAGVDPTVVRLAVPYIGATAWSLGPLLIYAACRRYLQAVGRVAPIVFALVSANLINVLANWVLVFGHWGAPALGVRGSGWATAVARGYMALVLVVTILWDDRRLDPKRRLAALRPDLGLLRRLLGLGFPAAVHVTLEVGVFAFATTLAGMLDPISLAAHQVVLSVASVTFMIPLGLSSSAAVRVGRAIGRGEPAAASRAGWMAIALGAGFMIVSGLTFLLIPRPILGAFTDEAGVIATGLGLLRIAAGFQLFDGLQGVTAGALRGRGDTHTPMVVNLLAHWALGLPVGYLLAFRAGLGVHGLWIGLSIGLGAAGLGLVLVWWSKSRAEGNLPVPVPEGG